MIRVLPKITRPQIDVVDGERFACSGCERLLIKQQGGHNEGGFRCGLTGECSVSQ